MQELIGIWRLVSTKAHDENGVELAPPYGPEPQGMVQIFANHRMMCVLSDGRANLAADEERSYLSYMGAVSFNDGTFSTRVDNSSDSARIGTDQVRKFRFEGKYLVLTPPPQVKNGMTMIRELTWEKVT